MLAKKCSSMIQKYFKDKELAVMRAENKEFLKEMKKLTEDCVEVVMNNSKECSEEIRKLKVEMDNMKTLVQNPMTECLVCLEIVRLWMRLIQCGMGHILCGDCYKKSREEARGREEGGRDMGR